MKGKNWKQVPEDDAAQNIFILGLIVLFAWMIVIILCASPQLFRDFIQQYLCFCWHSGKQKSLRKTQERMLLANKSFLNSTLTDNPSNILLKQVMLNSTSINIPAHISEEIYALNATNNSSLSPTLNLQNLNEQELQKIKNQIIENENELLHLSFENQHKQQQQHELRNIV